MSNLRESENKSTPASHSTFLENLDLQNRGSGATAPPATSVPPALTAPTPSTVPPPPTVPTASTVPPSQSRSSQKVTLEVFRALLGIPQGDSDLALKSTRAAVSSGALDPSNRVQSTVQLATIKGRQSSLSKLLGRQPPNPEYETSVYYSLVQKESMTSKLYHFYDILMYSCMIIQLIIASVLIILGAIAGDHHIAVAVLGATTGVITGILSLVKGQGFPIRLLQYGDSLRKVRDDIEFMERELRAGTRDVMYDEVVKLRNDYEKARGDELRNNPNTWTSFLRPPNTKETTGTELGY